MYPATDTIPRIVLVGPPGVGKSALFHLLTGARRHAEGGPCAGTGFESGTWQEGSRRWELIDLPGTRSLLPASPDEAAFPGEEVTTRAVMATGEAGEMFDRAPDLAVVLIDATAPAPSLDLLGQVAGGGVPVVAVVTRGDVAARQGTPVEPARLARTLGVPVVSVDPRLVTARADLARAVTAAFTVGAASATPPPEIVSSGCGGCGPSSCGTRGGSPGSCLRPRGAGAGASGSGR